MHRIGYGAGAGVIAIAIFIHCESIKERLPAVPATFLLGLPPPTTTPTPERETNERKEGKERKASETPPHSTRLLINKIYFDDEKQWRR